MESLPCTRIHSSSWLNCQPFEKMRKWSLMVVMIIVSLTWKNSPPPKHCPHYNGKESLCQWVVSWQFCTHRWLITPPAGCQWICWSKIVDAAVTPPHTHMHTPQWTQQGLLRGSRTTCSVNYSFHGWWECSAHCNHPRTLMGWQRIPLGICFHYAGRMRTELFTGSSCCLLEVSCNFHPHLIGQSKWHDMLIF